MLAGESSCVAALDLLVQRGADLHLLDSLGHDVLHYAKLSGSAEVRAVITAALQHHPADSGDYPPVLMHINSNTRWDLKDNSDTHYYTGY